LWEGSVDLTAFIIENRDTLLLGDLDRSVLELGCGHGLPGIAALSAMDCDRAVFSDFNESVLREVTWPNILLNLPLQASGQEITEKQIECWCGDWMHLSLQLRSRYGDMWG
jgi:predicted nicotinamide N-methyase